MIGTVRFGTSAGFTAALLLAGAAQATPIGPDDVVRDWPEEPAKIVGGAAAAAADWPFMVALRLRTTDGGLHYFCGGTVVAPEWVLTAAHCVDSLNAGSFELVVGAHDLRDDGATVMRSTQVIIHPGYEKRTRSTHGEVSLHNDVALVKLSQPWTGPVAALSPGGEHDGDAAGANYIVAGFGQLAQGLQAVPEFTTSRGGRAWAGSPVLLEAVVPGVKPAACAAALYDVDYGVEANLHLCAGYSNADTERRDSCQGDSGGPLVTRDAAGAVYQVGVVSFGYGCAQASRYGVYARVSDALPFVRQFVPSLRVVQRPPEVQLTRAQVALDSLLGALVNGQAHPEVRMTKRGADGRIEPNATRFREGDELQIEVSSDVAGKIVVVDFNATGTITQIYPNPGQPNTIAPGGRLAFPGNDKWFLAKATGAGHAPGDGRLVVMLVPNDVPAWSNPEAATPEKGFVQRDEEAPTPAAVLGVVEQVLRATPTDPQHPDWSKWGAFVWDYNISLRG